MGWIEGSLEARTRIEHVQSFHTRETFDVNTVPNLDKKKLIEHALSLAEELRAKAHYSQNGEPSWIILKGVPDSEQFMLDAMDCSLYDGSGGVALFLAGLEKVKPGSGFGDMAYSTIAQMRRWLKKARPSEIARLGHRRVRGTGFHRVCSDLLGKTA